MELMNTLNDLPKLSYTSWNVKDLQMTDGGQRSQIEPQSAKHLTNAGATNFNFQTKKYLVETSH